MAAIVIALLALSVIICNGVIHLDMEQSFMLGMVITCSAMLAVFMWRLSNDCVTLVQSSLDK